MTIKLSVLGMNLHLHFFMAIVYTLQTRNSH